MTLEFTQIVHSTSKFAAVADPRRPVAGSPWLAECVFPRFRQLSPLTGLVLLLLAAGQPAFSWGTTWAPSRSVLEITKSDRCPAEIVIYNDPNDPDLVAEGELRLGDLSVRMTFERDVGQFGADRHTAYPPPGFIAIPESVEVLEDFSATILICPVEGVGA